MVETEYSSLWGAFIVTLDQGSKSRPASASLQSTWPSTDLDFIISLSIYPPSSSSYKIPWALFWNYSII